MRRQEQRFTLFVGGHMPFVHEYPAPMFLSFGYSVFDNVVQDGRVLVPSVRLGGRVLVCPVVQSGRVPIRLSCNRKQLGGTRRFGT